MKIFESVQYSAYKKFIIDCYEGVIIILDYNTLVELYARLSY